MESNLPTQQRAFQTRAEILAAAGECFAGSGYDTTSVADICAAAGTSKGAFYHHFPSKQSVYLALLHDWLAEFERGLDNLRTSAGSVPETLRAMSTAFPEIFKLAHGQLPIILDFWVRASREPEVWEATVAPFSRYYDLVTGLIEEGIVEGSLERSAHPRQMALILVSMGVGALLQGLLAENSGEWGDVGQEGIDLILNSIERKP